MKLPPGSAGLSPKTRAHLRKTWLPPRMLKLLVKTNKILKDMPFKEQRQTDQWREQPVKALERNLESYCDKYAKEVYGCKSRKMNGMGFADWPDRVFLTKCGKIIWIEFKRYGEKPTPNQAELHKWMREHGHTIEVVDRVETFANFFKKEISKEESARRSRPVARSTRKPKARPFNGQHRRNQSARVGKASRSN